MLEYFLTLVVGIGASMISGLVGAGGGAVTVPYLIVIGLPPHIAIGTAKFGALGVTVGSVSRFRKTGHINKNIAIMLTFLSLPSAYLGLKLLLAINADIVQFIVGCALIMTVIMLFLHQKLGLEATVTSKLKQTIGYIIDFFVGLLHSAFSSGIGLLALPTYMYFLGLTAVEANATSKVPGLFKSIIILAIVVRAGIIEWRHAGALLLGSVIGSYIGAHVAIKKGNKFVKVAYAVVLIIMSAKLLLSV